MSPLDLRTGSLFAEDFQIVRRLGIGDNGAVYVVEHITTGAERALKVVAPHVAPDEEARLAFEREARVGAQIESDHVVLVVGAGLDPKTEMAWVAMELLAGVDLGERIASGGPMPQVEVALLFAHLCEALGAAHDVGITHGDVKPTNVFLAKPREGDAAFDTKVLDFGVAKLTIDAASAAAGVQGTPLWMAPEQATRGGAITPATDVWALALLAFFALTGKSYWLAARKPGVDLAALLGEVTSATKASATERAAELGAVVGFPDGFDAWFARCLAHDAEARFVSAAQAYAVLGKLLGQASRPDEPTGAAPPPKVPEGLLRTQNRPMSDFDWFSPNAQAPAFSGPNPGALPPPAFAPPMTPLPPLPPARASDARPRSSSSGTWKIVATIVVVALAASLVTLAYLKRTTPIAATTAPVAAPSVAPPAPTPSPADTVDPQLAVAAASASAAVTESPLVELPGGAFTLGLPFGAPSEHARSTVAPFAIEQHEVTVSAYAKCVAAGRCSPTAAGSMCLRDSDDNGKKPVNCVSYRQAAGYCGWIGRRLPTEAEWELAAGGRTKRTYPWARTTPPASGDLCWQRCKTSEGPCDVGTFSRARTPEGLDDMAGNVSEWTSSPYCPYDKPDCGAASRVTRGGGWCDDEPNAVKTTTREANDPTEASASLGFRCASDH
jgi:formylglycine-generating enzyme required for sulfatase activity